MFKGSMVALVTPMHADGALDKKSLHDLLEWHIASDTQGIIVLGTTGEAATLHDEEHEEIIALTVKQVAGRVPVIAGTGTNSTATTIKRTQAAQKAGVDACLVVTPYYIKPTQNGLFQHYKAVSENTSVPIILYNVPGRTGCDILPETVGNLSSLANIIGIKDATGKLERGIEISERCGKDFLIFSGDDETASLLMLAGAHGVISVTANIAPTQMQALCIAALSGNKTLTEKINAELMPLHKNLFIEANPIPTKWVLKEMGLIPEGIRLPLTPLDEKYHQLLKEALKLAGIHQ
jgi:4-hydroxy-tetrahydrodipicolinate synthase